MDFVEKTTTELEKSVRPFFIAASLSSTDKTVFAGLVSSAQVTWLSGDDNSSWVKTSTGETMYINGPYSTVAQIFRDHGYDFLTPEDIKAKTEELAAGRKSPAP